MEAVIWIGIAAIIVIAAVIAAIGRPDGGSRRKGRGRSVGSSSSLRRAGSYSGSVYGASTWSGDTGSGGGFSGGGDGGSCGG